MANYSLIINSSFKPFSYAEMLAPVMQATQAHQALEDAYGELDAKASIWDKLANESPDSKARKLYQGYADDLRVQADELAKNGLNPSSRQAMLNMRSRYAKDILPIENAWNRRNEDIKAQKQAMLSDPTHVFDVSAANTSLDKYLDNPTLDVMSANHSGALLTKQVADAARNFKKYLTTEGGLRSIGLPFQYVQRLRNGASPEEVMAAILRDPKASPLLTSLVDNVMAGSGIRNWSSMNGDWANNPVYNRLWNQAAQGLYEAIGNVDSKYLTDSYSMQLDLMRKKHAMDNPPPTVQHLPFNSVPLRSSKELDEANEQIEKYKKKKYFVQRLDGSYDMTPRGFDALRLPKSYVGNGKENKSSYAKPQPNDPEFYDFFVNKLNGGKNIFQPKTSAGKETVLPGWGPRRAGNLFGQYIANNKQGSYDTNRSTEFIVPVSESNGKELLNQIMPFLPKKDGVPYVQEVDFDKQGAAKRQGDHWKGVGDKIKITDVKGWRVTSVRPSKHGITLYIQKDNGEGDVGVPMRIKLPKMNANLEARMLDAATNATDFSTIVNRGYYPKLDNSGRPITDLNGVMQFTNIPLSDSDRVKYQEYIYGWNDEMNIGATNLMQQYQQEPTKISHNLNAEYPY